MPKMRLTQAAVDRLRPPPDGRVEYWDTVLPGFGLRVAPGGRKTWQTMYRVRGRLIRETLGTVAVIPKVDDARGLARTSMAKASQGVDPVAERKAAEQNTLDAVLDDYLTRYAKRRMRPSYLRETKRAFDYDVRPALGSKAIGEVTRRDVRELLDAIVSRGSPILANHVLSYLRAALNWAVANDIIEENPCDGLRKPAPSRSRDRALTDAEIPVFWAGCDRLGYPFGPLFRLLLLTGQRLSEVAEAPWTEIDADRSLWTLPAERAKNENGHIIHLAPQALEIIEALPRHGNLLFTTTGETPVSGFSKAVDRLAANMTEIAGSPPAHFTLHDLRRTCATGMAQLGVAPHIVDKILNHVSGKISGVAAIYNRFEYLDDRKAALDAWARHVQGLVKRRRDNVVTLGRGRPR